jgi:Asp-tRNA(Asn)/Glu-tRNA(Gln) amidotransferase A subunit family amidase/Asp-tRNA(Asn)/Glu-tRNA(Gln) amidotransferase C subunit
MLNIRLVNPVHQPVIIMQPTQPLSRRFILQALSAVSLGSLTFQRTLAAQVAEKGALTTEMIQQAEWVADLELSDEERQAVAKSLDGILASAASIRKLTIDADTPPAQVFRPDFFYAIADAEAVDKNGAAKDDVKKSSSQVQVAWSVDANKKSAGADELAFASIAHQASLLATKQLSSRELTELYLARLKRYDPVLKCVVTLLEEHALQLAKASDERRVEGRSRGVLDGIPWVAKDLIAMPPWKTTWGAEPFKEQVRPNTATVASRLAAEGAVVLAKVTLGALAWGDVWFGGTTRSPWNTEQGSSGSSAGSASSVAAGLSTFALGSETLGSIVSPCRRCRTSGLRPTFGRISRAGCMPLAWSMDKIGPIARHVDDLALVFGALLGTDGKDPSVVERPFQWPIDRKLSELTIGVTEDSLNATEQAALDYLKSAGAKTKLIDLKCEIPVEALSVMLGVEAAAVFESPFRADRTANYGLWSSTFRNAQFVTAVHFLQANRLRGQLITETQRKLSEIDLLLGGDDLTLTNLTGHPSLIVQCGSETVREKQLPGVIKLTAAAYREDVLLHVGKAIQAAMPPAPNAPNLPDA